MPVEVKGIIELQNALKEYAPDLYKQMNKEWAMALSSITAKAKGFIPSTMPPELRGWERVPRPGKERRSMTGKQRPFPVYDGAIAKRGVQFRYRPSAPNYNGFRSLARIQNMSAAGAIFETAGRKNNLRGSNKSQSNNPNAGTYFISILQHLSPLTRGHLSTGQSPRAARLRTGRAIFRAWDQDQGKTIARLMGSVEKANKEFTDRVNASTRRAA